MSLQECLTLELVVTKSEVDTGKSAAEVTDIAWKGLRCTVAVEGHFSSFTLDIRTQAGNAASSVVVSVKQFKDNGTASVVVEDEELQGCEAFLVILSATGELMAESKTVIGGG